MKRKARAALQKCGNLGVCEISAPVHRWAERGELRARRNEHLTLENAILRLRFRAAKTRSRHLLRISMLRPQAARRALRCQSERHSSAPLCDKQQKDAKSRTMQSWLSRHRRIAGVAI